MNKKQESKGCGCSSIPLSLILIILGVSYWLFTQRDNFGISKFLYNNLKINIPFINS